MWRALTNSKEFGTWFGARLDGDFRANASVSGPITIQGFDHLTLHLKIERIEPESYFSYRWHPYAVDPSIDYSSEPTTLVEFKLEDVAGGGTALTVIESGFEHIPLARRAKAF
ncbi:MAG TPA: SRPBCC family protein, partial [Polyangiaceae bacterium]|nr:SRPBCC family protein [Polyangiaceae bacterium]